MEGITPVMSMNGNDNSNNWWWVVILFLILGRGFGGEGLTQTELQNGFDTNSITGKLDSIGQGVCSLGYENAQLVNNSDMNVNNGFNAVNSSITQLGYQMQNCCCGIERNIDALKAENYQNTCKITTAIHDEGCMTRQLIQDQSIKALEQKLAETQLSLSNMEQNQYLISQLKTTTTSA